MTGVAGHAISCFMPNTKRATAGRPVRRKRRVDKLRSVKRPKPAATPAAPKEPVEDPVVAGILDALASGASASPRDIAQHIAAARAKPGDSPNLWRRYFMAVKQRAVSLAREGRIEIVRKGQVVDPEDFKGVVRYRLTKTL